MEFDHYLLYLDSDILVQLKQHFSKWNLSENTAWDYLAIDNFHRGTFSPDQYLLNSCAQYPHAKTDGSFHVPVSLKIMKNTFER